MRFLPCFIFSTSILFGADGAALYSKCALCHGKSGELAAIGGNSKIIKDMNKADFIASLKGYKDDCYGGMLKGLMKDPVAKLTEEDIKALADYIIKE